MFELKEILNVINNTLQKDEFKNVPLIYDYAIELSDKLSQEVDKKLDEMAKHYKIRN